MSTPVYQYTPKKFTIPALDGISEKTMQEHIGLYEGYVKNFNAITEAAMSLMADAAKNAHAITELWRRRSFEFDGMRLHEHYFAQLEGGAQAPDQSHPFWAQVKSQFPMEGQGQPELLMKNIASTRGPGWAILYWDPEAKRFESGFSGEQHQGHFVTLPIVLALDVWEHAFILDYGAQDKGKYVDAFFKNLNWKVVEQRFEKIAA